MPDPASQPLDTFPPLPFWLRARLRRRLVVLGPPMAALIATALVILWTLVAPWLDHEPTQPGFVVPFKMLALLVVGGALGVIAIPFLLPITLLTSTLVAASLRTTTALAHRPGASRIVRWFDRQPFWGGVAQGLLVSVPLAGLCDAIVACVGSSAWGHTLALAMMVAVAVITGWSRYESPNMP